MDDYLVFAKDLAYQSGKLIKDNFEANLEIELKSDHTPVTQVDKQINHLVIEAIQAKYPEHGVLGEEANLGSGHEELQWLCDPLDGTAAFIVGMPHSTFILALTRAGQIELAVVYNPFTNRLYHARKGEGAYCNDQRMHVNKQVLSDGYILVEPTAPDLYRSLLAAKALLEPVAGAGYRAMLLASGRCSAIIQGEADNHDVGPASLIVEEAGGKVSAYDGSSLRYDEPITGGVILSNGLVHEDLIKIVQKSGT